MSLKWTLEGGAALGAVLLTTAGGLWTTSYHWGKANEQIGALQTHQVQQDVKIDSNISALAEQKTHDATIEQKLNDVKDQLDRIEKKL